MFKIPKSASKSQILLKSPETEIRIIGCWLRLNLYYKTADSKNQKI